MNWPKPSIVPAEARSSLKSLESNTELLMEYNGNFSHKRMEGIVKPLHSFIM